MDRGNVTSGAAFKTAARATLVFLMVLVVAGILAWANLRRQMMTAVENQILEDQIVLNQIYHEGGPMALINVVDSLRHPFQTETRALGLFQANGAKLAGNISGAPTFVGWKEAGMTLVRADGSQGQSQQFYLNASQIDEFTLVVGRDLTDLEEQEVQMLGAFAAVAAVVSAAVLAIGYFASLQSLRKLENISATLNRVSQGDSAARLEVSQKQDQIDRVAAAMNLHLDRLSTLLATTKASAAAIAHDLRTPLSRAFLALDRATAQIEGSHDPREALDDIEAELTRLRSIFDAILRISRLEASDAPVQRVAVPLAPLLGDLCETFAPLAEEKGQTLMLEPVSTDLAVMTEENLLAQVMANLVQNAITHCPSGASIKLAVARGDGVVLSVVDNGPGIPTDERERVFDLFYRIDPNRSGPGNGLGMTLVKAIAERLGATIRLDDAGPGLRVEVNFPASLVG